MEENRELMDLLRQIQKTNRNQTIACTVICVFGKAVGFIRTGTGGNKIGGMCIIN